MSTKIRTICVDTLTALQEAEYMRDKAKPNHDDWRDYGQDIYIFVDDLLRLGFECILVLGEPGTGKSSGMMTLPTKTNIWYNADNKNPVWTGGKLEYGKKNAPIAPYHIIPTSYKEIIAHIKAGIEKGMFEDEKYAFITGHTEQYKSGVNNMERLKTLGKLATKMRVEGKLETVLYSKVSIEAGKPVYQLETQNNGFNTARSPMELFEGKIPNDYNLIIEKLVEGY